MRTFNTPKILYIALLSIGMSSACKNHKSGKEDNKPKNDVLTIQGHSLSLQSTIKLNTVKGGFDLMALDNKGQRLFLSAQDNHSVEIVDIKNNKPIRSLPGFDEPKWIVYRPESNRLYVATGNDGKVTVLDATTYSTVKTFSFEEKCNNLHFDTTTQRLYVGVGKTIGAIGVIDCKNDKVIGEIRLADFPKQFELDSNKIYVNIPSKNIIEVIDLSANKVIARWRVTESTENVPMALDKINHHLFIACEPGKFIVYSTKTGKSIASLDISKNADGIYLDPKHALIYISCADGYIDVIEQKDNDTYIALDKIETAKGAGTSLFSQELQQLYLAVPQSEKNVAELRIYSTSK